MLRIPLRAAAVLQTCSMCCAGAGQRPATYRLADGNEERAAALFRGGYCDVAKHKKMQALLRTASSPAPIREPAPPLARIPIR